MLDFELFRDYLEDKLLNTNKKNNAGAKPIDVLMMFKILILQRYYGLGDQQVEYQILDRTSFKSFLGLSSGNKVPDEKTVRAFREKITKLGLEKGMNCGMINLTKRVMKIFPNTKSRIKCMKRGIRINL